MRRTRPGGIAVRVIARIKDGQFDEGFYSSDKLRTDFLHNILKTGDEGLCWKWRGRLVHDTPVLMTAERRAIPARYYAHYFMGYPPPSPSNKLLPKCGIHQCVNPDHLASVQAPPPTSLPDLLEPDAIVSETLQAKLLEPRASDCSPQATTTTDYDNLWAKKQIKP